MWPVHAIPLRDVTVRMEVAQQIERDGSERGLGTGLLPAYQASRLKIVDALRRTG